MKKAFNIRYAISTVLLLVLFNVNTVFANASSMTLTVQMPYGVEISVGEHGKVSVDGIKYTGNATLMKDLGSEITYEVSANLLYKIDKVLYNGEDVTAKLADGKFTAPALTENATFKATFKFIIGGGSSEPEPEPADSSEESSGVGTASVTSVTGPKSEVTLVTDSTGRKSESKTSVTVKKKSNEEKTVESTIPEGTETDAKEGNLAVTDNNTEDEGTNSPSDKNDVEPEGQPGSETTIIPPSDVPKSEGDNGYMGIAVAAGVIMIFGTATFMHLKKKKDE